WLLWSAGAILFYTVAGFLIAPPIVRAVATRRMARELNREVSIASVRLNPYAMSATIRGFLIKDKDGQPFVSWDEVYVNFEVLSVFKRSFAFQEVRTTQPYIHVQINRDYTFNFSDILEKIAREAAAAPKPRQPPKPSKPLGLHVDTFTIHGARLSLTDLTMHQPFTKIIGPLEISLDKFDTHPDNKNPYSFSGQTQEGEKFSWNGHFFLDPVRSIGDFSLENLSLAKYAPLYQDLVRFEIRDGIVDVHASYHVAQGATTNIALLTNTSVIVRGLKLAENGAQDNALDIPEVTIAGLSADAFGRSAAVGSIQT